MPTPDDANESLPGSAFAFATSSHALRREIGRDDENVRRRRSRGERYQVGLRAVRQIGKRRGADRQTVLREEQRVAIARRFRRGIGRDCPRRPRVSHTRSASSTRRADRPSRGRRYPSSCRPHVRRARTHRLVGCARARSERPRKSNRKRMPTSSRRDPCPRPASPR